MMPRLFVVCLCAVILLVVQAQPQPNDRDRETCKRITDRCNATQPPLQPDEALNELNRQCAVMRGNIWRDLTRCQHVRAECEITMVKCQQVTCKNLQDVIGAN